MGLRGPGTDAIDKSLENVTYKERDGYPYIIHPLLDGVPRVDPELLREWTHWTKSQSVLDKATVLLAPEAMGIHLAVPVAMDRNIPYVVARKREYGLEGETVAYCETGYGSSCIYVNDITADDRVVIIDDVISTGGTLSAIINTIKSLGARVEGVLVPITKGDGAEKVRMKTDVPVAAMRRISFDADGQFVVS